jgi:hypothetical protein
MSEFVDECRREWKRLRVPDPVANEMAADLAADLKEAEAEGASTEQVLGSGAFDARSFAASWAAERGVIPPAPPVAAGQGSRVPRRSRLLAAAAVFVLGALLGGALVTVRSGSEQRVAIVSAIGPSPRAVGPTLEVPRPGVLAPFGPLRREVMPAGVLAGHVDGAGFALHTVGLIFLFIGLVGLIVTLLYWSPWARRMSGRGIAST